MQNTTETILWAGSIIRYHNRPTAQRQTVGEHTWRVMIIYTELYGEPDAALYRYILLHDVAEIVTGDIPFMVKRYYPNFKLAVNRIEIEIEKKLDIKLPEITTIEHQRVKTADLLEMLFFAIDDVNMGCRYSYDIILNILEVLDHDSQILDYINKKGYQDAINRIIAARED